MLLCERATLLTEPWLMFFKAPGHARRAVVLEHRDGHDLVDRLGDQLAEVGAVLAVVLGIVAVGNQVHPDEGVVVETRRSDRSRKSGKSSLNWFAFGVQPAPPDVRRVGSCGSRRP